MKEPQEKVKSLTGIKNAILKHEHGWITLDKKTWVFAGINADGSIFVNYGLSHERVSLHKAMGNIFDFLSFKRSTDLLGG